MTDELLNAAILLRRGSWVDPELFERAAKRMAELESRETSFSLLLIEYRREHVCHCSQHDLARTCFWCRVDMALESAMEST